MAPDISPRFFLLSAFLPFVFLGLIFEAMPKKFRLDAIIPGLILVLLIFSNVKEIKQRFLELFLAGQKNIAIETDLILKEKTRVTYAQEQMITRHMIDIQKKNSYPILFYGEPRYVPALAYILDQSGALFNDRVNHSQVYRYANYFWVDFSRSDNQYAIGGKEKPFYDITEIRNFGTLTILRLSPKEEAITDDYKIFEEGEHRSGAPKRFKWNELF